MGEARSHRVFFALWPDDEATAHLSALAHELTTRGGGRVMRPASLHLTLAFVGAVTPSQLPGLEEIAGDGSRRILRSEPRSARLLAAARHPVGRLPADTGAAAPAGRGAGGRPARRRLCHRSPFRRRPGAARHAGAPRALRIAAPAGNADRLAGRRIRPGRKPPASFRRDYRTLARFALAEPDGG
jgi:hypothetical protein